MRKIVHLSLFFVVSLLLFVQTSSAQARFQGGISAHYSEFLSGDANGIGVSGGLEAFIMRNLSAGLSVGYNSYSLDNTDLSVYALGRVYLSSQGFRPYVSFGYGFTTLSGTYSKGIWINDQQTIEEFEDKTTSPSIRAGAGMLYPINGGNSINFGAFLEHQTKLPEHIKIHIGINKLF